MSFWIPCHYAGSCGGSIEMETTLYNYENVFECIINASYSFEKNYDGDIIGTELDEIFSIELSKFNSVDNYEDIPLNISNLHWWKDQDGSYYYKHTYTITDSDKIDQFIKNTIGEKNLMKLFDEEMENEYANSFDRD